MSEFKKVLVDEINRLRNNPPQFAQTLKDYMTCFSGNVLHFPGNDSCITTEEGPEAYKEGIDFLLKQERREPLNPSKGLCRICQEYISKVCQTDDIEKVEIDDIIKKYGSYRGTFSRAIDFGGERPENVVVYLIVCDGDKSRGQRNTLLNPKAKQVGVGIGKHPSFGYFSVIITCSDFRNKIDSNDNGFLDAESLAIKIDEKADNRNADDEIESETKEEKIITENGRKIKLITKTMKLKDGRKKVETEKIYI